MTAMKKIEKRQKDEKERVILDETTVRSFKFITKVGYDI
jgi:hypothetical protein